MVVMGSATTFFRYSASAPHATAKSTLYLSAKSSQFHACCCGLKRNLTTSTFSYLLHSLDYSANKVHRSSSAGMDSTPFANASSSSSVSSSAPTGLSSVESPPTSSDPAVGFNDLLIVGPGALGRLVAKQWREIHPQCQVYGQTLTSDHHGELLEMGIKPSLSGTKFPHRYPYVIFCAPPNQSLDYARDIREAVLNWNGEGSFLFTSSSAPFDCFDNGYCDESTPSVSIGRSPRTDVLLKAEKVVVDSEGCVLRLAGLYKADRGVHRYWVSKETVEARPDTVLNLIHYEDAASLAIMILKKHLRGRTFLGCDNHPLSCQEIADLVNRSGKFSKTIKGFTGTSGPLGKRLNNSKTRAEIGWEPKYSSFGYFLETLD